MFPLAEKANIFFNTVYLRSTRAADRKAEGRKKIVTVGILLSVFVLCLQCHRLKSLSDTESE